MAPVGWPPASNAVRKLHQLYDNARSSSTGTGDKPKLFPPWRFKVKKLPKQPEAEPPTPAKCVQKPVAKPRAKGVGLGVSAAPAAAERSSSDEGNRTPRVIAAERKRSGGATVIEVNCDASWRVDRTVIAVSGDVSSEEFDSVISSDDSLPFDGDVGSSLPFEGKSGFHEYVNCRRVENEYAVIGSRLVSDDVASPRRAELGRGSRIPTRRSLPIGDSTNRADEWARVYACYDALEAECRGERAAGKGKGRKSEPLAAKQEAGDGKTPSKDRSAELKVKSAALKSKIADLKAKTADFKCKAAVAEGKNSNQIKAACELESAKFKAEAAHFNDKTVDCDVKKADSPDGGGGDCSVDLLEVSQPVQAILRANIFGKKARLALKGRAASFQGRGGKWVVRRKSDLAEKAAKYLAEKQRKCEEEQRQSQLPDKEDVVEEKQTKVDEKEQLKGANAQQTCGQVNCQEDKLADNGNHSNESESENEKSLLNEEVKSADVEQESVAKDEPIDKLSTKQIKIVEDRQREIVEVKRTQFVQPKADPVEEESNKFAVDKQNRCFLEKSSQLFEVAFTTRARDHAHNGRPRYSTGRRSAGGAVYRTEMEVFFRSGALAQLEAARDERLSAHVQRLQARCRGMLARRRLAKLRLHDVAVRCVQRNVRLLLAVRSWPWWKLLMRITPLLGVRSAEQQLQLATEELTAVRAKTEKLEAERAMLQQESDRMAAQLSEMSADLADERAAAQLAAQRLDAETAHRTRLERDLADTQARESKLSAASARLEAELLAVRADDANVDADADDDEAGAETLRARLARAGRELALLRHRLTQQHADDLEQLVALKKQMEKKLADVYEDVNAQRQTAAQAQRKAQKLSSEGNDLRLHLEEQAARNALLEKKQRRFDAELQAALESGRTEKRERERAARERDLALAEKTALEQSLSATQLEVQLREDQAAALTRELDAAAAGGHSELELASLRRTRHELESKLQEQEDELDDLAGQLAMLGQAKLRLEMSLEQQRKEARREQAQRDEELDEARGNASKKVKALEAALEGEHEERTRLLREKHELERRANDALAHASRSREEQEQALRARKELKRTRALLKDAQQALAQQQDAPNKALLRQLRHQLEDAEAARAAAARGRQGAETELAELRAQLDEAARAKQDAESRANAANREKQELKAQLDENEEELSEVLKKYGLTVSALSAAQAASAESAATAAALEAELRAQREAAAELQARLDAAGADPECSLAQRRLELRVREAESRLELEQTTKGRLEVQISRLKEAVGRATSEAVTARGREAEAEGAARRASRQLREAREAAAAAAARDSEAAARRKDAEQRLEAAAAETAALRQELRTALARVADLQLAMQDECSLSDSGPESDSDESIESFLVGHDGSERDGSERDGSEAPSHGSTEQRLGLEDSIQESFA